MQPLLNDDSCGADDPIEGPADVALLRRRLLSWFAGNARDLPWRRTSDPYSIWVSEIMLQQTRVDQAEPYYRRFIAAFPCVEALASADLDDVLRLWEGLGYYSRARNLHRAAQQIASIHRGRFPESYDGLCALPGIGPYTAAAVASIAFGEPRAVVDGNVIRVIARLQDIEEDVTRSAVRRKITDYAQRLLDPDRPGTHNEAMMELGATICTPGDPHCGRCPIEVCCEARRSGEPSRLPVRARRAPTPHFDVAVGIVYRGGEVLIQQRPHDGLLGGLWEFPGGKREAGETIEETCVRELEEELGISVEIESPVKTLSHAYTHFKITLHAFRCRILRGEPHSRAGMPVRWAPPETLTDYAFPRANRRLVQAITVPSGFQPRH